MKSKILPQADEKKEILLSLCKGKKDRLTTRFKFLRWENDKQLQKNLMTILNVLFFRVQHEAPLRGDDEAMIRWIVYLSRTYSLLS